MRIKAGGELSSKSNFLRTDTLPSSLRKSCCRAWCPDVNTTPKVPRAHPLPSSSCQITQLNSDNPQKVTMSSPNSSTDITVPRTNRPMSEALLNEKVYKVPEVLLKKHTYIYVWSCPKEGQLDGTNCALHFVTRFPARLFDCTNSVITTADKPPCLYIRHAITDEFAI